MGNVLQVEQLKKRYRGTQRKGRGDALSGVDLHAEPGEIIGLLGPNGAGKSTLVKIVCGLVQPTSGTVTIGGAPVASRAAQSQIGYLAELFRQPPWLTADAVLTMHQRLARAEGGAAERRELLQLVDLADAAEVRVSSMSKGMQQRLGLAQALIGSPALVLLDEPTSALDPAGRALVREVLSELRSRGQAVLLSSHLLGEVELVADRVAIIARGQMIAEGSPRDLQGGGGVEFELASGTVKRTELTREEIPAEVAKLVAAGEQIYGVRELRGSLEAAYLRAIEAHGDQSPAVAPAAPGGAA